MSEFTGERLVPGEVDVDLWNEHLSRYAFAASLSTSHDRVLDAGCGTGYGSRLLAPRSSTVLGIDRSHDAIAYAARQYGSANVRFAIAECERLPLPDHSVDLLLAFEVIEHLEGWREFLREAARVLTIHGACLISTPNAHDYLESRGESGPNPFHVHEFSLAEFQEELARVFPQVRVFGQNHGAAISFTYAESAPRAEASFESLAAPPEDAAFLLAACGHSGVDRVPDFVFVPRAANVVRERERHIQSLQREHDAVVKSLVHAQRELERSNAWAVALDAEVKTQNTRILQLQDELAGEQALAQANADRLEFELLAGSNAYRALESELMERTEWAHSLDREIAQCAALLAESQNTVAERTQWALNVQAHADELTARLNALLRSRWMKVGRVTRLGPAQ